VRPANLGQASPAAAQPSSAPLPPVRPAGFGQASAAQQPGAQINIPMFDVNAMPSRPVTPTPSPNAAPLAAAAAIPVSLPPASTPDSAALNAAASIPVQPPAASAPQAEEGPWTLYQTAQPSQPAPAVTRDPWERPTAADTLAAEGPWTLYQTAHPSQPAVTRDPWERPANNDDKPWLDYQPAQPATQQNGPRVFGQAANLDDPYANASTLDDVKAIGRTADNAVRNTVDGMTLGYGNKVAAGLDALTGRSPDYASALNAERAQSAQAMAQSPGGIGTAEQIAGMALPAGAIGRGAAAIGDAATALPFGLGRFAASPLVQASATGAAVGGLNAAGNDQDVAPNAVLGALAGAGGNAVARTVAPILAGPTVTAAAPSTQAFKAAAQSAYGDAFQPGHVIAPEALQRLSGAIRTTMAENAYDPALQPRGVAIVNHVDGWPASGVSTTGAAPPSAGATLKDLNILRQKAAQMYDWQNPNSGRIGGLVKGQIDQFVNGLTPADIAGAASPGDATAALGRARQAWTTYAKSNDLDEAVANAQDKAGRAIFPNANLDKLTRDAIAKVRDSRSNWTPDELAALNEAAAGTPTQRALRMVGALAPTNPISAAVHLVGGVPGALATGGLSALAQGAGMAAGFGGKAAANRLTANAVNNLSNIIRSGGASPTTVAPMGPRVASPLAALLMGSGVNALQPAQPYGPGLGATFAQ
jgi:hypothetical protein